MFKLKTTLDRHSPRLIIDDSLLADPPLFSLPSTFKMIFRRFTELFPFDQKKVPVNRKHDKRYEFFHSYLSYGARCDPETGGVLKRGKPGCRIKKF
jgi:hypothetical protein